MTTISSTDVLVIGGGPVGLYAAFYVALRGLSVRLVEARPELGGQLTALYPEKFIYDVPGFPAVRGADLAARLWAQLEPLRPDVRLGETVHELTAREDGWTAHTDRGAYEARAVIVTAGIGALRPRAATVPGVGTLPRVTTELPVASEWAGLRVLVWGGVPQATQAALDLHEAGAHVTLSHRRALFRGTPEQLARLGELRDAREVEVLAPADLVAFEAGVAELRVGTDVRRVGVDAAYLAGGYLPDLTPLRAWGLDWQGEYVVSGAGGATNRPGVFVAGDLSADGGDLKLIAQGFAQAAVAANHAVHFVRPDLKVKPGHSSDRRRPGSA